MKRFQFALIVVLLICQIKEAQSQSCSLVCDLASSISIGPNCMSLIDPLNYISSSDNCTSNFSIELLGETGQTIPSSPYVTVNEIGTQVTAVITNIDENVSCDVLLDILDKSVPDLICSEFIYSCTQENLSPSAINFSNTNSVQIQNNCETIEFQIAGINENIADINIGLDLIIASAEYELTLTAPSGEVAILMNSTSASAFCANNSLNISFDQNSNFSHASISSLCNASNFVSGVFQSEETFSIFEGIGANGTWTLEICETDGGTIEFNGAGLDISTNYEIIPLPLPAGAVATVLSDNSFSIVGFDGCGSATLTYIDLENLPNCTSIYNRTIERNWTVVDEAGNESSCVQTLLFLREQPQDVDLPVDRLVSTNNALACDLQTPTGNGVVPNIGWNSLPNGNPSPDPEFYDAPNDNIVKWYGTGRPEVGGCYDLDFTYSDLRIEQCSSGASQSCFKVNRTWTAIDPCDNSTFTHLQQIYVFDPAGPTISGLEDVTISTQGSSCQANWIVPIPTLNDDCSDVSTLTYTVTTEVGNVVFNGIQFEIYDLVVGDHNVTISASDCCGNTTQEIISVQVRDQIPPYPVCESYRTVGIGSGGTAKVLATSFDDGSNDGCGPVFFKVIRFDNLLGTYVGSESNQDDNNCDVISGDDDLSASGNQIYFDDEVYICCEDLDGDVSVVLRVFDVNPGVGPVHPNRMIAGGDLFGRFNDCMPSVRAEDKLPPQIYCPANITINCDQNYQDTSLTGVAIASDNCSLTDLSFADVANLNQCGVGTVIRVWTATDHTGLTTSCTQLISLVDNTNPVISYPSDRTVDCIEILNLSIAGQPEVEDNCALIGWNFSDELFPIDGTCSLKILRTWSGMDICDWVAYSHTQKIIAIDEEAPVFNDIPNDVTVNCENIPDVAIVTADDACDNFDDILFEENIINQTCLHSYVIERIWTATDVCGNTNSEEQLILVQDIEAPTFDSIPQDVTLECFDQAANTVITATDNCDPNPRVIFSEAIISGDCPNRYTLVRTWLARDTCGNENAISQNLIFQDNEGPQLINIPIDVTISCGDQLPTVPIVTTSDNCDSGIDAILTTKTGTEFCDDGLILTRIWTAMDLCGNTTVDSQQIYLFDNDPPVLINVPADQTLSCDDGMPTDVPTAFDDCSGAITVQSQDVIQFTACFQRFQVIKIWTATDECMNTTRDSTIYFFDDNIAPVLNGEFDDITLSCSETIPSNDVSITDNCDGNPTLSTTEEELPGLCPQEKMIVRTWTGTDGCGNTSTETRTITIIDDQAPTFSQMPADVTVDCDNVPAVPNISVTDDCDANASFTFDETRANGDCPNNYTLTRTWSTSDACGNSNEHIQIILVADTTAPNFIGGPARIIANCDDIPAPVNPTAVDNCDVSITLSFDEQRIDSICDYTYRLKRVWKAIDDCGNESEFIQNVIVQDTVAPVLDGIPVDMTIDCTDPAPPPLNVTVSDNCNPNVTIEVSLDTISIVCPGMGILRRTWTANDGCGNSTSATQILTFENASNPTLVGVPDDITVDCEAIPDAAEPISSGACGSLVTIVLEESILEGDCPNHYTLTRKWTAKDECDNSTSEEQIITVQDTTAPVLSNLPMDFTIDCTMALDTIDPMAVDNCDTSLKVVFQESEEILDCAQNKIIIRTWTYTDDCDNQSSHTQNITIQDTVAPVLLNVPIDVTVSCDFEDDFGEPTLEENCDETAEIDSEESEAVECEGTYVITRTWIATDDCGNSVTAEQKITVKDELAPTLSDLPSDVTVDCDAIPDTAMVSINDICDEEPLLELTEVRLDGNCPGNYLLQRIWVGTDDCNNMVQDTQFISVQDTVAPIFEIFPDDFTVECANSPLIDLVAVTVTDNCDENVNIEIVQTIPTVDSICANKFIIRREYTATDNCGNSDSKMLKITVHDQIQPFFNVSIPDSVTVQCDNIPSGDEITAIDNCGMIDVTFTADTTLGFCVGNFIIDRYFVAEDACGNSTFDTMRIKVVDTTPPTFTFVNPSLTVSCDELPVDVPGVVATDNCGLMGDVLFVQDRRDEECLHTYKLVREWSIIDECSNSSITTQIIQVRDSIGPVLISVVEDVTVSCDDIPTGEDVLFEDSCDGEPTVEIIDTRIDGNCEHNYIINRKFIATDDCMNRSDSVCQMITVFDTEVPTFTCPDDIVEIIDNTVDPAGGETVCALFIEVPLPTGIEDNCDSNPVITNDSEFAISAVGSARGSYPIGVHTITYTMTDDCMNSSECSSTITVLDKVAPEITCNGVTQVDINPATGVATLFIENFMPNAQDCQDFDRFFLPDTTTSIVFDCDDVDMNFSISAVAIDVDGNFTGCFNIIEIADPMDFCPPLVGEEILGLIANEDNQPTEDVSIFIDGAQGINTSTNEFGAYSVPNLQIGADYTILPKSNRDIRLGVTTLDLVLLSRHLIGLEQLDSPYKIIAADVDYSKNIDAFDLIELQKLLIYDIPQFQNGNAWRFVDRAFNFKIPSQALNAEFPELIEIDPLQPNQPSADFISIKLGDLNNSYYSFTEDLNKASWDWAIPNIDIRANTPTNIPVYADQLVAFDGLQAEFIFDENLVSIVDFAPGQLSPMFNILEGHLLISAVENGQGVIDANQPLFTIVIETNRSMNSEELFGIGQDYLPAYAVSNNLISNSISLTTRHSQAVNVQSNKNLPVLYSNRPNPFSEQTTIRFSIPEADNVVLSIMDVSGRALYRQEQFLKAGYHEIVIWRDQLKSEGVLISQLITTNGTISQKLLLLNQ